MKGYSVLLPVYIKDRPDWLAFALESICKQTLPPAEYVVVHDGPITDELWRVLQTYKDRIGDSFRVSGFEKNNGLGVALAYGVEQCKNEIIARMDADDYSVPDRCEKELLYLHEHPNVDIVGCNVAEFIGGLDNVIAHVNLPENQEAVERFAHRRCPIRHPALMYRRDAVLAAGNYHDFKRCQDYELTVRLLLKGSRFYNIQEQLVYMRVNTDFYARRGGWGQAKSNLQLKKLFLKEGFYTQRDFMISGLGNAIVCVCPNFLREFVYKTFLRR